MSNVNYGYEESRREQASLHEDLDQREKALRDTRIRDIHEVEELKRAQEMRVDEFSRNELGESHATIQEVTSKWKIASRFQSAGSRSKSSINVEPRPKPAI